VIAAAIGPLATLFSDVIRRAFPDKTEAARIEAALTTELLKADLSLLQGQMAINAEEARSESMFVAGWRPFVGWTCGAALAWNFVLLPFLSFGLTAAGVRLPALPELAMDTMMPVLTGMLGLGAMRTFEKYQGANKRR
jgi:holin (3TMs family)